MRLQGMVCQTLSVLYWVVALVAQSASSVEAQSAQKIYEAALQRSFHESLTQEDGGSTDQTETLDPDVIDEQVARVREGDISVRRWIEDALSRNLRWIDPVWGGAYRSIGGNDLEASTYEKPLELQVAYIRVYSNASILFQNNRYRDVAVRIAEYAVTTLGGNDGHFFNKQTGAVGPRMTVAEYFTLREVQRQNYAMPLLDSGASVRANALMVQALCDLYTSSLDPRFLDSAKKAMKWLTTRHPLNTRERLLGGEEVYNETEMAAAMLSLYSVTADRSWLDGAIDRLLVVARGAKIGGIDPSTIGRDVRVVRIVNLASHYSGRKDLREFAEKLSGQIQAVSGSKHSDVTAALLLMLEELRTEPAHITVVGAKDEESAKALWLRSLRLGVPYSRREWLDRREGPLLNSDTQFPPLSKAAAFLCANKRCSLPLFTDAELSERIEAISLPFH